MVVQCFKLKASASENEFLKGIKAPGLTEVKFDVRWLLELEINRVIDIISSDCCSVVNVGDVIVWEIKSLHFDEIG